MKTALVGFGGFGRTLAALLDRAGWPWMAHDPRAAESVPLEAALKDAKVAVFCVKEADLSTALAQARPLLPADALALDVCARKAGPCALLAARLGAERRHAGCHPRFGARSLELGLPLPVTLCSSGGRPGSLESARAFWEGLECAVEVQPPEINDREL